MKYLNNNYLNQLEKKCDCPLCNGFFYIYNHLVKSKRENKYITKLS